MRKLWVWILMGLCSCQMFGGPTVESKRGDPLWQCLLNESPARFDFADEGNEVVVRFWYGDMEDGLVAPCCTIGFDKQEWGRWLMWINKPRPSDLTVVEPRAKWVLYNRHGYCEEIVR